jgi:hypothetical protein
MFSEADNNDNITTGAIMVFLHRSLFPFCSEQNGFSRSLLTTRDVVLGGGGGGRGERKIHFLSHSSVFKAFALHFPWVGIPVAVTCSA